MSIKLVRYREVPERLTKEETELGCLRENLARERAFIRKQVIEIDRLTNLLNTTNN